MVVWSGFLAGGGGGTQWYKSRLKMKERFEISLGNWIHCLDILKTLIKMWSLRIQKKKKKKLYLAITYIKKK